MPAYEQYLTDHLGEHIELLKQWLRIPSISALSEHKEDTARAASWLHAHMRKIGLENVKTFATDGHPIVYGDWLHRPGAPTALVYGHYDVQPVDPLEEWESAPFTPEERGGRLFARGVSDDKGQVMVHLAALEALLQTTGELPINVKVLIEGEEEVGSPSLERFVKEHKSDLLKADLVVASDTSMVADGLPTICTGLRGIAGLEMHVYTANTDLHSGLYGGAVANATQVLVDLLATVHTSQGRINVNGFYDAVIDPSPAEREAIAQLPFDARELQERCGTLALAGEVGFTPLERMTVRPTFELNGIWGGFQGEGSKTVIPREAHAKITCRLVPDQDPAEIQHLIAKHFASHCPATARLEIDFGHTAKPWKSEINSPPIEAARRALEKAFGRPAALAPMGGSIPVVEMFDVHLGVPCALLGFAAPDSNAHAPNESFPLETFDVARKAVAEYWHQLAELA